MRRVLDYIIINGEVSRSSIAEAFSLSTATVTNIVSELIEQNFVYESRRESAAIGRKTTLLRFNADRGYVLNIAANPTYSQLEFYVTNLCGDPILSAEQDLDLFITDERRDSEVLKEIIQTVQGFVAGIPAEVLDRLQAAVLCIGGMARADGTVDCAMTNWQNFNLSAPLKAALHLPVYVEGVTRIKALYEIQYIPHVEKNVLYLNLSPGIGITNFFDNKMIEGHTGIAGEAGHMSLDVMGPRCYCGNRGCFEGYCGFSQILKRAETLLTEENKDDVFYDMILRQNLPLTVETVFLARSQGSIIIHELLNEVAEYLGAGIANLFNIFDPDLIVVSGPHPNLDDFLLDKAKAEAKSRIINKFSRDIRIVRARLKHTELHRAIARFALKKMLDEQFG